jgi:hypothetical protein
VYRESIFSTCYNIGKVYFIVFMEHYLTCMGKILEHLTVSHAAPASSWEVAVMVICNWTHCTDHINFLEVGKKQLTMGGCLVGVLLRVDNPHHKRAWHVEKCYTQFQNMCTL